MKKVVFFLFLLMYSFSFSNLERSLKIIKNEKGNDGKRYAILIGVNDYADDKIGDLKKARNDAKGIGEILKTQGQFDHVYIMTDDLNYRDSNFPSKLNIEQKIRFLSEMTKENDMIIFGFSGHGITNNKGESYLIPVDARFDNKFDTAIKLSYIEDNFKNKNKTLLLVDACREEISETKGLGDNNGFFANAEVSATFYATKKGWYSYEDKESDYGIFSKYVIEGLKGIADRNNDKLVSFSELEGYVQEKVANWSFKSNKMQIPYTKLRNEKFGDLALSSCMRESTGLIEINVQTEGNLYVNGGFIGKVKPNKKKIIEQRAGNVAYIKIVYGDKEENREVKVIENKTFEINFSWKPVKTEVLIDSGNQNEEEYEGFVVKKSFGNMKISSKTAGKIYIDGEYKGDIGYNDEKIFQSLKAGMYQVKIEYEGNKEEKFITVEKNKTVLADFNWKIYYGNLIINTKTAGKLYINGEYKGELGFNGRAEFKNLKTGNYKIKMAYAENFEEKEENLKPETNQNVNFTWTKGYGNLKISTSEDVKIYINDKFVDSLKKGGNVVLEKLEEKEYTIKFAGNKTEIKKINIKRDIINEISYGMPEIPENFVLVEKGKNDAGEINYDFYMGKYEVTQAEWKEIMGNNPSYFTGDSLPVERVSWYDVIEYCNKRSEKEGLEKVYTYRKNRDNDLSNIKVNEKANGYRFPTQKEWEYAARGGNKSKGYEYSGSNNIDEVVWYWDNSKKRTHQVGIKKANELGIYDMSGNVWEWCWNIYGSSSRIICGGSWYDASDYCGKISFKSSYPNSRSYGIGFRLCRTK